METRISWKRRNKNNSSFGLLKVAHEKIEMESLDKCVEDSGKGDK